MIPDSLDRSLWIEIRKRNTSCYALPFRTISFRSINVLLRHPNLDLRSRKLLKRSDLNRYVVMHSVLIVNFLLILTRYSCFVNAVCTNNVPCFPTPVDILGPSTINRVSFNVSSVCGNPVESFCSPDVCRLVCNASSPTDKHSKELMIDKYILPTYWKSKNLEYPVTIQLDLKQKLILHQMTITFQFEYPSYASIERSQDFGTSFYTIHRNAISCLASSATVASTNYKPASPVCMAILTSDTSKAVWGNKLFYLHIETFC